MIICAQHNCNLWRDDKFPEFYPVGTLLKVLKAAKINFDLRFLCSNSSAMNTDDVSSDLQRSGFESVERKLMKFTGTDESFARRL